MTKRHQKVTELQSLRGKTVRRLSSIEKAGKTSRATVALEKRGGIGGNIRDMTISEINAEIRSLKKFIKAQTSTVAGIYKVEHAPRYAKKVQKLREPSLKYERSNIGNKIKHDNVEISSLTRQQMISDLHEYIPMINTQVEYLKFRFGDTPATEGLKKAGGLSDTDIDTMSVNELRKLYFRMEKFVSAKTSTETGADKVEAATVARMIKAGVKPQSIGGPRTQKRKDNISEWYEIMHKLQDDFPQYIMSSDDLMYNQGVNEILQTGKKKFRDFDELYEYVRKDYQEKQHQKAIALWGDYAQQKRAREAAEAAERHSAEELKDVYDYDSEGNIINPFTGRPL